MTFFLVCSLPNIDGKRYSVSLNSHSPAHKAINAMNSGPHNLSPARRAKRCALSLIAGLSLVAGGTYFAQLEDKAPPPYAKAMTNAAGPATVRSDTVIAREGERL